MFCVMFSVLAQSRNNTIMSEKVAKSFWGKSQLFILYVKTALEAAEWAEFCFTVTCKTTDLTFTQRHSNKHQMHNKWKKLCEMIELNQQVFSFWMNYVDVFSSRSVLCNSEKKWLCLFNKWEFTEAFCYSTMFSWSLYHIIQTHSNLCVCVCLCVQFSVYSLCSSRSP